MSLNCTELFTALGRCARYQYIVNGAQAIQDVPFNELAALSYVQPAWISTLAAQYDPAIRSETTSGSNMVFWQNAALSILMKYVALAEPTAGTSRQNALSYVYAQMVAQSESVKSSTISAVVTADAANVGTGNLFTTLTRADGVSLQNTIAETGTVVITNDSFTGTATQGQEPWRWNGAPNVSSFGTGTLCGLYDWDWPQGSSSIQTGYCIAANAYALAGTGGNYLTNGDFAQQTTITGQQTPNSWHTSTGTWGTSIILQNSVALSGYAVEFVVGATLNDLTQQFNTTVTDTTLATAGTTANPTPYTGYAVNFYLKGAGVISGGVMTVSLVDGSGTVVNDQAGTPNSGTITLSAVTTSWVAHSFDFRLPTVVPSTLRLKIKITTALAGSALYMDWISFGVITSLYAGGPRIALFSNPAAPFEANLDPDGYTIAFANNYGGAMYGANFQTFFSRYFQTPSLILPYSGSPTQSNVLITGA